MVLSRRQTAGRVATARTALARLQRWLPAAVGEVLARLTANGGRAVLVGGAVRDAFLNRSIPDWDIATDLEPGRVAALFERVVRAGEKHGTIMVLTASGGVEVTTFRGEGPYLDGRRPAGVSFLGDLEQDLARRDFTINAMAADLVAGRIVDPFAGKTDLRRGRVRCVGDPKARFSEDGLRPLRAVRFAAVLGFRIDRPTQAALAGTLSTLERVAWERKRDEIAHLLGRAERISYAIRLLAETGMLGLLAADLSARRAALDAVDRLGPGDPWLRFACWALASGLSGRQARSILDQWRVAIRDSRACQVWVDAARALGRVPPRGSALRRWTAGAGEHALGAARLGKAVRPGAYARFPAMVKRLLAGRPPLRIADLAVRGNDLEELGLSGKAIGRTLNILLDAVLEDPRRNSRRVLLRLAHRLSTTTPQA